MSRVSPLKFDCKISGSILGKGSSLSKFTKAVKVSLLLMAAIIRTYNNRGILT